MTDHNIEDKRPLFLWSHPRTGSNLFVKVFSNHPQLTIVEYTFMNAWMFGPERQRLRETQQMDQIEASMDAEKLRLETYQYAWERFDASMKKASQENTITMGKEHVVFITRPEVIRKHVAHLCTRPPQHDPLITTGRPSELGAEVSPSNPTVIPDVVLHSFRPIFIIRHPVLMIPSYYRAIHQSTGATVDDIDFPMTVSYRWSRLLYDWYTANANKSSPAMSPGWPIVIDANDFINNTEQISSRVVQLAGLPASGLQFSWSHTTFDPNTDKMTQKFRGTLSQSTGIIRSQSTIEQILKAERDRWPAEFGLEIAEALEMFVTEAMPDYLALYEKRLL